jgi:hypothetical protein
MRAAIRSAVALMIVLVVAGCWGGERLQGPSLAIRNETAEPVVVRVQRSKWEVPASGSGYLGTLPWMPAASVEILDPKTCARLDTVAISFQPDMDQVLTVPASGTASSRATTIDDDTASMPKPSMDPNRCVGPEDFVSISVENRSSMTFDLVARSISADLVSQLLEVAGKGSGSLASIGFPNWGVSKAKVDSRLGAGAIDLIDPASCRVLATVEFPDYGSFVVTIDEGGALSIADGPLPTGPSLPKKGVACQPGGTPLPPASPAGS